MQCVAVCCRTVQCVAVWKPEAHVWERRSRVSVTDFVTLKPQKLPRVISHVNCVSRVIWSLQCVAVCCSDFLFQKNYFTTWRYIYMYIYMYICICICICIYTCIMRMNIWIRIHTHILAYEYKCEYICTCTCMCLLMYTHTIHTCVQMYIYTCTYICAISHIFTNLI